MSKSNIFENDLLLLIFNAIPIVGLAINETSNPLTSLEVSLHTADPGEAGDQLTNELTYTGYSRIAVVRTSSGWTVAVGGNSVTNAIAITFGLCTAGLETATHFAVGTDHTGNGRILHSGALNTPLVIEPGIIPVFPIGDLLIDED